MKKILPSLLFVFASLSFVNAQPTGWSVAGDKIKTPWAEKVNPLNPLPEYPLSSSMVRLTRDGGPTDYIRRRPMKLFCSILSKPKRWVSIQYGSM